MLFKIKNLFSLLPQSDITTQELKNLFLFLN